MISTKFIRFSFDKLARTHKIARSLFSSCSSAKTGPNRFGLRHTRTTGTPFRVRQLLIRSWESKGQGETIRVKPEST